MRISNFRKFALVGALGTMGMSLIGVGAHAVFTTSATASQTITAGTLTVVLSTTEAGATGNNTTNLTLPSFGPTGSSFTTGDQPITIKNTGNIPANETLDAFSNGDGSDALSSEAYLCVVDQFGYVDYNGLFSGATSVIFGPGNPIAAGSSVTFTANIYAGSETTACGSSAHGTQAVSGTSTAPSLTNTAEGNVMAPTLTLSFSG
jgi:hypothetical protein